VSGAYYNEINPKQAARLRNLIRRDLIAPGDVDERSIEDVQPDDVRGYTQCHFFAGIGVWSYALRQAGWTDEQECWTGSCPCQPFSSAGKGKGVADERHLWPAFEWLISQCAPITIFGEQVAQESGKSWIDIVSTDLEGNGYTFGATDIPACGFGADHKRRRLYWSAYTESLRQKTIIAKWADIERHKKGFSEPSDNFAIARRALVNGVSGLLQRDGTTTGVERTLIEGYGNSIVAPQAIAFIEAFIETQTELF